MQALGPIIPSIMGKEKNLGQRKKMTGITQELVGKVDRDPMLKVMPSGRKVVSVGVNLERAMEYGEDATGTGSHSRVLCFDELADWCMDNLGEGDRVRVKGRQVKEEKGRDRHGYMHYFPVFVHAEDVQLLESDDDAR